MVSGFAREGKSCLRSVELSMDWIAKRAEEWLARRWGMFPARESLVDRVESREEEREKMTLGGTKKTPSCFLYDHRHPWVTPYCEIEGERISVE